MKIVSNKLVLLLMLLLCASLGRAQMTKYQFVAVDSVSRALIIGAEIHIIDTVLKSEIGVLTDTTGMANIRLPIGRTYRYYLSAINYYDSRESFLVTDSFEKTISVSLQEISFSCGPTLPGGVYFKKGADILDTTNQKILDEWVSIVNTIFLKYPNGTIYLSIEGHTRNEGNLKKNYELGLRRAYYVEEYINSNVKGKCRIVTSSAASFKLVNACDHRKCTEEEFQLNDRAIIRLVGFSK